MTDTEFGEVLDALIASQLRFGDAMASIGCKLTDRHFEPRVTDERGHKWTIENGSLWINSGGPRAYGPRIDTDSAERFDLGRLVVYVVTMPDSADVCVLTAALQVEPSGP